MSFRRLESLRCSLINQYFFTNCTLTGKWHQTTIWQIIWYFARFALPLHPLNVKSMKIEQQIEQAAMAAVKALYGQEVPEKMVQLQKTRSEFEGSLTLVVFPFVKMARKSPEQTGQEIGQYLVDNCEAVSKFNVVKGFLNLSIADAAWLNMLADIDKDDHYGEKAANEGSPLVMIEYSSPNTNKPLHLGHVRNNLLGWSLAQIMQANGNKVVKTNIVNDRGIHICKSMLAWLKYGNGETPETSGKKGDHLIGDANLEQDGIDAA